MLRKFIFYFLLINTFLNQSTLRAQDYDTNSFKSDWSAPLSTETSKDILLWGSGLTALLIVSREEFTDEVQRNIAKDKPLGDYSRYGDLAGRMVPNLLYIGYQWKFGDEALKNKRMELMFKTSIFSGATTFFFKRLFNQQRPNSGDRNSFPSGHTTTAFAFSTVVALEHPAWAIPAYALSTFVGMSRMNDNAHYLHDVTMGATIGLAYAHAFYHNSNLLKFSAIPYKDGLIAGFKSDF